MFKVGDMVMVMAPPYLPCYGILKSDWENAIGRTFRISRLVGTSAILENSPASCSGFEWVWPGRFLRLATKHPVEVF